MASKYAHIIARLKKLLPADARYQEKVEEVKRQILAEHEVEQLQASVLAASYAEIRGVIDDLERRTKDANLQLEAVKQMICEQFEAEDITSISIVGATVRHQKEPYAQVKDKERFRQWCINTCQLCGVHKDQHPIPEEGAKLLNLEPDHQPVTLEAQLQLWPSTMNSITKERLLRGYPEPEGVEAFYIDKLVLTREKE